MYWTVWNMVAMAAAMVAAPLLAMAQTAGGRRWRSASRRPYRSPPVSGSGSRRWAAGWVRAGCGLGDGIHRAQPEQRRRALRPDDHRPRIHRIADSVLAGYFVYPSGQNLIQVRFDLVRFRHLN